MTVDPTDPHTLTIVIPGDVYAFIAMRCGGSAEHAEHAEDAANILTSVIRDLTGKLRECDRMIADGLASIARGELAA